MGRILYGNFEFEYRIQPRPLREMPRKLIQINQKLLPKLASLAQPKDMLLLPEYLQLSADEQEQLLRSCAGQMQLLPEARLDRDEYRGSELVPWGWSSDARAYATRCESSTIYPAAEAVTLANSRATSFELEQEAGSVPVGAREITSLEDLFGCLIAFPETERWVIKCEYSMSSRDRLMLAGFTLNDRQRNWIANRQEEQQRLFLEPWLSKQSEISFHYQIEQDETVTFLGATDLITDDQGRYLGNQSLPSHTIENLEREWERSLRETEWAAARMAASGYFGPISFDAMQYSDSNGVIHQRPLQDINARYTMGRCKWQKHQQTSQSSF